MKASPTLRRYPLSARLMVAADGERASRRVRLLTGTSDWRRDVLDRLGSAILVAVGPRRLTAASAWPWPATPADQIEAELAEHLPGLRLRAAALPRQLGRPRLSLLCEQRGFDVVVKLGASGHGIEHEATVLTHLGASPLPCIATPTVLATGSIAGEQVAFLATDGLGLDKQRPAIGERLISFERDLSTSLAALPRPPDTDADAVPVHGDLAPWNLRRTGRGLALFDWESAGWGPPGSDLAHYRRACVELRR